MRTFYGVKYHDSRTRTFGNRTNSTEGRSVDKNRPFLRLTSTELFFMAPTELSVSTETFFFEIEMTRKASVENLIFLEKLVLEFRLRTFLFG